MYPLQRKYKTEWPTPEEEQVHDALASFCFTPDKTALTDFCPTSVLYAVYQVYCSKYDWTMPDAPDRLGLRHFGAALHRVFHLEADRKTRRWINGVRVYGFIFCKGPGSLTVYANRGNPGIRHAPAPAPAETPAAA